MTLPASFNAYSTAWQLGMVLQNTITLAADRKSQYQGLAVVRSALA